MSSSLPTQVAAWWLHTEGQLGPTGLLTLERQSLMWLRMFYSYRNRLMTLSFDLLHVAQGYTGIGGIKTEFRGVGKMDQKDNKQQSCYTT